MSTLSKPGLRSRGTEERPEPSVCCHVLGFCTIHLPEQLFFPLGHFLYLTWPMSLGVYPRSTGELLSHTDEHSTLMSGTLRAVLRCGKEGAFRTNASQLPLVYEDCPL